MAYATIEDYKEIAGLNLDDAMIERTIKRAEMQIALLLGDTDYNTLTETRKKWIKYATISQAEYLALNGENIAIGGNGSTGSFSIGSFSMSQGQKGKGGYTSMYSPAALDYLFMAGLTVASYKAVRLI